MSSLLRFRTTRRLPRLVRSFASEEESPWYTDQKPGRYPKTEEEKCAAAKKYGLLREEYEPYPDDGDGYGDYPKFEPIPIEDKSLYHPWHDNIYRRDHREPVNIQFPFYVHGRITNRRERHSILFMFGCFCLALGSFAAFLLLPKRIFDFSANKPIMEKQYPKPGVTHYTFEFAKEGSALTD